MIVHRYGYLLHLDYVKVSCELRYLIMILHRRICVLRILSSHQNLITNVRQNYLLYVNQTYLVSTTTFSGTFSVFLYNSIQILKLFISSFTSMFWAGIRLGQGRFHVWKKYSPIFPKFGTLEEQTLVDVCTKGFVNQAMFRCFSYRLKVRYVTTKMLTTCNLFHCFCLSSSDFFFLGFFSRFQSICR